MSKWVVLLAITVMAVTGFAVSKTTATRPADGAPQQAQASFARVAASRCGKRGASSCRPAPRKQKRSARSYLPEIIEIDINPLVVHARGKGAIALDALIVTA